MDKAKLKSVLPQEGTRKGESLPERSSGCPTFSGGGEILHDSDKPTTSARIRTSDSSDKMTTSDKLKLVTDQPVVLIERDAALDRFSVRHWVDSPVGSVADRKRSHVCDGAGTDEVETPSPNKVTSAQRGRTRVLGGPPRATSAPQVASGSKERVPAIRVDTRQELLEEEPLDIEALDPASLRALATSRVNTILEVCKVSSNLKGTCVKALKEAARTLQEVITTALTRTVAEETLLLRRETRKLRDEVAELKAELAALRSSAEAPPPPPVQKLRSESLGLQDHNLQQALFEAMADHMARMERSLRVTMGEVVTAQIEALEDRLLPAKVIRPPLAADRTPVGPKPSKPSGLRTAGPESASVERTSGMGRVALPVPASVPPQAPSEEGWTTVTRRRRRKRAKAPAPAAAAGQAPVEKASARKKKPRVKALSKPRSAAVVITLQPEAQAEGLTYLEALTRTRGRINVAELGIENISLRPTAAGSRIIEIPGERGAEQADKLAEQLQQLIGNVATVVRPVKRANVRVIGLDESVSVEEVVVAAAAKGGCEPAHIKAGVIRPYGWGSGAVHLSLPVTAAKVLVEAKRLLVGWSAARVRLLKGGPMRCYKCMDVGHKRPLCPSMVDRGILCFRCGQPGHKALECVAEKLHCALCADAGRPSGHHMGGAGCKPPPTKSRTPRAPRPP